MNIVKMLTVLLLSTTFQGCAVGVLNEQRIKFSDEDAELVVVKRGCLIRRGEYSNRSGRVNSSPSVKFIAVGKGEKKIGEWYASCKAAEPNRTSDCDIMGETNVFESGGLGCPELLKFKIVYGPD